MSQHVAKLELGHQLYSEHNGWLCGWLNSRLRCHHDAADLAHDTFLRVLTSTDLTSLREPRAFLLVVANRLLINRHRRRGVEQEALHQVAVLVAQHENRGPERITAMRELLAQVLLLLVEELPEKPGRAFLMARMDGMSYREIAKRLDVSQSSVKQYLAQALAHCHARLYDSLRED